LRNLKFQAELFLSTNEAVKFLALLKNTQHNSKISYPLHNITKKIAENINQTHFISYYIFYILKSKRHGTEHGQKDTSIKCGRKTKVKVAERGIGLSKREEKILHKKDNYQGRPESCKQMNLHFKKLFFLSYFDITSAIFL
jgi:hypothetical protein